MWPYLFLGGLILLGAVASMDRRTATQQRVSLPLISVCLLLVLFIGLRHNIGMDWNNYLGMMSKSYATDNIVDALAVTEPGYALLLWMASFTDLGIYVANFITALIIVPCIVLWARKTPEPWLALLAAYPFFILVFALSANRQSLAAAGLMAVVAFWPKLTPMQRVAAIIGCAMFHYSALVFIVFVALDFKIDPLLKSVMAIIASILTIYGLQYVGQAEYYNNLYGIERDVEIQSAGALFHIALNALPASLYFLLPRYRDRLFPTPLIKNLAFAALLTLPLALIFSTAASRINFYWTPMAMYVIAALPGVFEGKGQRLVRMTVAAAGFAVAPLWLLTANSAFAYLPYQNALAIDERMLEPDFRYKR